MRILTRLSSRRHYHLSTLSFIGWREVFDSTGSAWLCLSRISMRGPREENFGLFEREYKKSDPECRRVECGRSKRST